MKLSFGISVNLDLTNDLYREGETRHTGHAMSTGSLTQALFHVSLQQKGIQYQTAIDGTYSDMTSGGKLRGIIPALSHSALSLVHMQDWGQRGGRFLLSTTSSSDAATRKTRQRDLLGIFGEFPMLANAPAHAPRLFSAAAAWRPSDAQSARVYIRR